MLKRLHFFCDESGNTGGDYLNPEQPYFVTAGFAVGTEHIQSCRRFVSSVRAARGVAELKGSALVSSATGRAFAVDLITGLYQRGAAAVYVITEKRYALGAWFVNLFLDLDADGSVSLKYNQDQASMTAAAEAISALPLPALRLIVTAIQDPSEENQTRVRVSVAEALREAGNGALADDVTRATPGGPMFGAADAAEAKLDRQARTPNTTAYLALIGNAQRVAEGWGADEVDFVHDETSSFEPILRHNHAMVADPIRFLSLLPWLERVDYPWLHLVDRTRFVPSHTEPLIQAADVLGASLVHISKAAHRGKPLDQPSLQLFNVTLRPGERDTVPLRWWVVTPQWWDRANRYGSKLVAEAKRRATYPRRG